MSFWVSGFLGAVQGPRSWGVCPLGTPGGRDTLDAKVAAGRGPWSGARRLAVWGCHVLENDIRRMQNAPHGQPIHNNSEVDLVYSAGSITTST